MRIARVVFIVMFMLGGVSLYLATARLWDAHQLVVKDHQLAGLAQSRSDWYQGTVALSFERSVTQVALALDDRVPDTFRALIDEQRRQSDTLLDRALAGLDGKTAFENRDVFLAKNATARAAISDLRLQADALLARPKAERDAVRAHALPYELKAQIENLYAGATLLVLPTGLSSTREIMLSRIQALAWEIREYGGRARTFYAIATLTGEPIPEILAGEAMIDTSRAKAGWHHLNVAAQAVDMPPELLASIADVSGPLENRYFGSLQEIDQAMQQMRNGVDRQMPYDFETFFGLSNEGLDAVATIAPIAGAHIQDYWATEIKISQNDRLLSASAVLLLVFLTGASLYALQVKMTKPLSAATRVLQDMAAGKLDRHFRKQPRGIDEVRVIWEALEALQDQLKTSQLTLQQEKEAEMRAKEGVVGALLTGLERMSQGDLTYRINDIYGPAYSDLVDNYNSTTDVLRGLVSEVIAASAEISSESDTLHKAIADLSSRTDEQSRSLAETVAKLEAFSGAIKGMADSAGQSDTFVAEATEKANASGAIVDSTVSSMERIRASSRDISQFTKVIDDIAFQTGLLALNAGVEASRAGEVGRGFAVVAHEVRSLSMRAADAAEQIKQIVEQSGVQVESGVEQVGKTGASLSDIVSTVQNIREKVADMSRASQGQATAVSDIGDMVGRLDHVTKQNAAMVNDTTQTGARLQTKAAELRAAVDFFEVAPARVARPSPTSVDHIVAKPEANAA